MDTIDSSRSNLPAQFSAPLSVQPALVPSLSSELATASMPQINSRVLLRGLTRHWWRILGLWLLLSVPTAYFIWVSIEPTYEAFSTLLIEPSQPELFGPLKNSLFEGRSILPYLETQVNVIRSDKVLEPAVANPSVVNLPIIRQSKDPKVDLRKRMSVDIMDSAYMIRVALELPNPEHAATIVNTVIETYLAQNNIFNRSRNKKQQVNLETQLEILGKRLKEKTKEMEKMVSDGKVALSKPLLNPNYSKDDAESVQPTFSKVTEEQYQNTLAQIQRVDYDLVEAQAMLRTLEENAKQRANEQETAEQQAVDEQLKARIEEEFNKDPDVVSLTDGIASAREHLRRAKSATKLNHDPAVLAAQKRLKDLNEEWGTLWEEKYAKILARLRAGNGGDPAHEAETVANLKIKIESLNKKKESFVKMLEINLVESKKTNGDTFRAMMLNHDLNNLMNKQDSVSKNLEQLKFEAEQDEYRVFLQDIAAVPKIASNNKRLKYIAAAPVAVLFVMLGLFMLLEIRAELVADPDALSTRVRSEVFALPPIISPQSMRKLAHRRLTTISNISCSGSTIYDLRSAVIGQSSAGGAVC